MNDEDLTVEDVIKLRSIVTRELVSLRADMQTDPTETGAGAVEELEELKSKLEGLLRKLRSNQE